MQYYGNQRVSASGSPCLRWDNFLGISGLSTFLDVSQFPDASLDEASNKCRYVIYIKHIPVGFKNGFSS